MAYKEVRFLDGAPIDPNDLNQLMNNISQVRTNTKMLTSTITNNQSSSKIPRADANVVSVPNVKKDSPGSVPIGFTSSSFKTQPYVVATIITDTSKDYWYTVRVLDITTTGARISITTNNPTAKDINCHWIALELVTATFNFD